MPFSPPYLNVRDFGAIGSGTQDDFPAFKAALDEIAAGTPDFFGSANTGTRLLIPPGFYRLSQPIVLTRCIILQGAGMFSTILDFTDPDPQVVAPSGVIVDVPNGAGSSIRDCRILRRGATPDIKSDDDPMSRTDGTSTTRSGIVLRQTASIQDCHLVGFEHDGIHINPPSGNGADNWQIVNSFCGGNGRHGLFVQGGADSHGGIAVNLHVQGNRCWGIYERLIIGGNTYIGCYADVNKRGNMPLNDPFPNEGGAYKTTSDEGTSGFSTFLGCSYEDGRCELQWGTVFIGGSQNGRLLRDPAAVGNHDLEAVNVEPDLIWSAKYVSFPELRVRGGIATRTRPVVFTGAAVPLTMLDSIVLVDASVGDVPLELPALDPNNLTAEPDTHTHTLSVIGRQFTIKRIDNTPAHVATVAPPAGRPERIDGNTAPLVLDHPHAWISVVASGIPRGTPEGETVLDPGFPGWTTIQLYESAESAMNMNMLR
jgi:hypothetical protein